MRQSRFMYLKKLQIIVVFLSLMSASFLFCSPIVLANPLWIQPGGPYEGTVGEPIHFYLDIQGGVLPYHVLWDFGDDNTSTVRFPDHTYIKAGIYSVKAQVTDGAGDVAIRYTKATIYDVMDVHIMTSPPYYIQEMYEIGVTIEGGKPPYAVYWDNDADGFYDDGIDDTINLSWDLVGSVVIAVKVIDSRDSISLTSVSITVNDRNEEPLIPSRPIGESQGKAGRSYSYATHTVDPNTDQVYYQWDWGDGTLSAWIGPYASNTTCQVEHVWQEQGQYAIRVMAKDTKEAASAWSEPYVVSMPCSRSFFKSHIMHFLSFLLERHIGVYR